MWLYLQTTLDSNRSDSPTLPKLQLHTSDPLAACPFSLFTRVIHAWVLPPTLDLVAFFQGRYKWYLNHFSFPWEPGLYLVPGTVEFCWNYHRESSQSCLFKLCPSVPLVIQPKQDPLLGSPQSSWSQMWADIHLSCFPALSSGALAFPWVWGNSRVSE